MAPADEDDARPHGRDEVVAALLAAATAMFAERGPAAVSLREVAAAANVNPGLIHRHIGGKEDLLAAVLQARPGMPVVDPEMQGDDLDAVFGALLMSIDSSVYTRLAARTILDGYDYVALQGSFPLVEYVVGQLEATLPPGDAAVRAAFMASMVMGWHLFGRAALAIVGQADGPRGEIAARLRPALEAFAAAPPAEPA